MDEKDLGEQKRLKGNFKSFAEQHALLPPPRSVKYSVKVYISLKCFCE